MPIYAVVGAHGKTSTTGLLAHVMTQFSSAFGFSVGGVLQNSLLNGKDGASGFVIEGDESDGSFLRIHPEGSIVTNIDPDHLDFWKDFNTLKLAYKSYLETIKNKELIFFAKDEVCDLIDFGTSYGIQKGDIQALDIQKTNKGSYFTILDLKQKLRLEKVFLPLFGDHQIKNALGVYGMSTRLGVPKDLVIESFKSFEGLKRRSEWIATIDKASIYLDYGHHPKELAATFHALREQLQKKLIVVFEPHKYSRTKSFFVEFLEVLKTADTLFLIETYPAAEAFDYEGSSEKLAKYLNIEVTPKKEVYDQLQGYIFTDVTILFIGAGNIDTVCKSFCEKCSDYARTRD
jgi:UDP-N-acetylmuramate--alanine ligase